MAHTAEELRKFYDTSLLSVLTTLDQQRKKVLSKLWIMFIGIGGLILGGFGAVKFNESMKNIFAGLAVVSLIFIIVFLVMFFSAKKKYVMEFKNKIISNLVKFIDQSLNYSATNKIGEMTFRESQIFLTNSDRYRGEDYVSGKLGKTAMEFSEVHAEYKTTTTDSKGRRQTHWHTIFKGIFFIADFSKNFNSRTIILPDTAQSLFGRIGQALQSMNFTRPSLIKMEDPEFEKHFVVYGDDQVESRYILSTSLMKRITDFKNKTKKAIHLSFIHSKLFLAIQSFKDYFEPALFSSVADFEKIQQHYENLNLAIDVVEDLNLNTRIWSKQ